MRVSRDGREIDELVRALPAGRFVLGITGAPGAGKSTLAAALAATYGATVVPMDGFHLADVELVRRGLLGRKGAPETFDAEGYAALLARVRVRPDHVVLAPAFERDLEQPVAGAIPVEPGVGLVVTEGNYLLLDDPAWARARRAMDRVWFVAANERLRTSRLIARHVEFGKTESAARAWVADVDERNAARVSSTAGAADRVIVNGADGWAISAR